MRVRTNGPARARCLAFLVASAGAVSAHNLPHPKKDAFTLSANGVRAFVDYEVNPGPDAQAMRELFDRDSNGHLSPPEQELFTAYLVRTATLFLKVTADGVPLVFKQIRVVPDRVNDDVRSSALLAVTVELFAPWPGAWPHGWFSSGRRVIIEDRSKIRDEDVPAVVRVMGVNITHTSQGEALPDGAVGGVHLGEGAGLEIKVQEK